MAEGVWQSELDPDALHGIPEMDTIEIDHRGGYNIHGKRASDLAGNMREMAYSGSALAEKGRLKRARTHRSLTIMKHEDVLTLRLLRKDRHQVSTHLLSAHESLTLPGVRCTFRVTLHLPIDVAELDDLLLVQIETTGILIETLGIVCLGNLSRLRSFKSWTNDNAVSIDYMD